jgi:hypothetical protein
MWLASLSQAQIPNEWSRSKFSDARGFSTAAPLARSHPATVSRSEFFNLAHERGSDQSALSANHRQAVGFAAD